MCRAREGHNVIIIGRAGTGKSFIAKEIMKSFLMSEKRFQLVCSTGIGCEVYKDEKWPLSNALVFNSYFGIGLTRESFSKIVEESVIKCKTKLSNIDSIIWDEFSMNSSRDLELINSVCCKVKNCDRAFGGVQFILVGDWLQLNAIPDNIYVFRDNIMMYKSPIFSQLLRYSIELDRIFKQDENEKPLSPGS